MTDELDWTSHYIWQAHMAAMTLRCLHRRLGWRDLEHLRETKRWIDTALEKAEEFEKDEA